MVEGELHHLARFRPLTGNLEYLLNRATRQYLTRPEWVTTVIANTVEKIGTLAMTNELAAGLSVGDRMYLMLQLAIRCDGDQMWLTPYCASCGEPFDVSMNRSEFQIQHASKDYPTTLITINEKEVGLRAVNGEDQCWLIENSPTDSVEALLSRCIQNVDRESPSPGFISSLDKNERQQLEAIIQGLGPDVDCTLPVKCPECTAIQELEIDPYWLGQALENNLDDEIHTLAFYYHWSESEILNLTRDRRHTFIHKIDKELGRHV